MDYLEFLENGNIEDLDYAKEANELSTAKPNSYMDEETKLDVCFQDNNKDPNETYMVYLNEKRCGEVQGKVMYMCQHHYNFLAEKRSQFPA